MSKEETKQDRARWTVPNNYPFSPESNWNPRNEREWVHELTQQVEYLTRTVRLMQSMDRAVPDLSSEAFDDTKEEPKKPTPKTPPKTPPKSGGGKK